MHGSHESFDREEELETSTDRNFGFVMAGFCALVGSVHLWKYHAGFVWLSAAAILALIAWFSPKLLAPFNRAWTKLGLVMFHVVNPVVLLLIYVTAFLPIGWLMRLCGKDPLNRKYDPQATSYWIAKEANALPLKESLKNQF